MRKLLGAVLDCLVWGIVAITAFEAWESEGGLKFMVTLAISTAVVALYEFLKFRKCLKDKK